MASNKAVKQDSNVAYSTLEFYAYNWVEIERNSDDIRVTPTQEYCFFISSPKSEDIYEWIRFFISRRKNYVLFEGTAKGSYKRRSRYQKVWALCTESAP